MHVLLNCLLRLWRTPPDQVLRESEWLHEIGIPVELGILCDSNLTKHSGEIVRK